MFKRILVPLDGSERAEQALPVAAHLAKAGEGSLLLLRVVDTRNEFGMYAAGMGAAMFLQEELDKELTRASAYLARIAHSFNLEGIETRIAIYSGRVAPYILDVAREQAIDVIVMCSHGYTGFKRWALGSVAEKVSRQSPVPLLLLRDQNLSLKERRGHPLRATVALDGSPFAEDALLPAVDLVTALSAPGEGELHLMQLVKVPTIEEEFGEMLDADFNGRKVALQEAGEYLQAVRARLLRELPLQPGFRITWSVEECKQVADTLIQITELGNGVGTQKASDLIVLTTHGRRGFQQWLLGSVTGQVLQKSTLPLFIVRPQKASREDAGEKEAVPEGEPSPTPLARPPRP